MFPLCFLEEVEWEMLIDNSKKHFVSFKPALNKYI